MNAHIKKVSVIIPTYNRADLIGEAISSVLAQSFTDFELIILDDASTDDTEKVVRDFMLKDTRIRYVRQPRNIGISKNRNAGIAEASGTYVAMLDSDDIWIDREKLAKQVAFLDMHPDHALVGTWIKKIGGKGMPIGEIRFRCDDADIRQSILRRNQFAQSSVLFLKKATLERAGNAADIYDPALVVNEDYDLWLRIGAKYKFANIAEFATAYRVHGTSIIREKRLLAARLHLSMIRKYRREYPGYFSALVQARLRIFLARLR